MEDAMIDELFSLENKVALVTGAGGHLGQAMTRVLASAGATVYAVGRNIESINQQGLRNIIPMSVDINRVEDLEELRGFLGNRHGHLDVLINNAYSAPMSTSTLKDKYLAAYEISLASTALLAEMMLDLLKANNGASIINIASMYGSVSPDFSIYKNFSSFVNPPFYGAAKAALIQWTKYMACLLGEFNIRVNSISPGPFPNASIQESTPGFIEELKNKNPMHRVGKPEELQGVLLLLASEASSFITGQNIAVDGGWTVW